MLKILSQKKINLNYLHPLLFAIYPLLAFYTSNMEKLKFTRIVQPLEISIVFTIGLWLLLNTLIRNKYKTSFLVTYCLVLFFSYGHVYNALEWLLTINTDGESNIGLFSVWSILMLVGGFIIVKWRKDLTGITKLISKIGIFLIILSVIQILYFNLKFNKILSSNPLTAEIAEVLDLEDEDTSSDTTGLPDIYYIILDGYASNESLKDNYGFDNKEFTSFLEDKGFKVASDARSNYALTFLSLTSSLNMKYLNYLTDVVGENSTNTIVPSEMIKNNEVLNFLKTKGYQIVHFASGWRVTNRNKFADLNIYCVRNNDYTTVLLLTTMLRPFENMYSLQSQRERVLCTFSRLASIREETEGPLFIFAHIISPHPPFVFGENGEVVNDPKLNKANNIESFANKEAYTNQLKFINKKAKELVEKLTAEKDELPIIIIQADHGSAATGGMEEYNPALIQERMRPFVATYLPGKNNFIPDSLTPVNIFRLIFNNYFNTKHQILDNKVYFSTYGKPYKFVDVTETVWKLLPK